MATLVSPLLPPPWLRHLFGGSLLLGISACCHLPKHVEDEFVRDTVRRPDGLWVVDGDVPLRSEAELREFYRAWFCRKSENAPQKASPAREAGLGQHKSGLAIAQTNGADARWSDSEKRRLTYCVSSAFSATEHVDVVAAMASAGQSWTDAADVAFVYDASHDANCTPANPGVIFNVVPTTGQAYRASAFLPDWNRSERTLFIDASAFSLPTPYTLTGILRHELGHALGFRHEHTRQKAGSKCYEDAAWRGVTSYDPNSVMHYPQCSGTNAGDLDLTALDRQGVAAIYGTFGGGPQPEICNNGVDDDLNGAIDDGCPAEKCSNGVDDDNDGAIDEGCLVPEICGDGIDNDGDGRADEDCQKPEVCNGTDDDLNGAIDDEQACHAVSLRLSNIDDDAYVWVFQPGSAEDAICSVRFRGGQPGSGDCDLSQIMRSRGNPESSTFVVKIGNGGGWNSSGTIDLLIDGRVVRTHNEATLVRHTGWVYRWEFGVDFKHGGFTDGGDSGCVNIWDCPN